MKTTTYVNLDGTETRVQLGKDVQLGNGVQLGEDVQLGNGVQLGEDVRLGDYVQLGEDVQLGNGVRLGADTLICAGRDMRGYEFLGIPHKGARMVAAGCRWFTLTEARAHWANNPEALAKVSYIESEFNRKG